MLNELGNYLRGLDVKDLVPPLLAGILTLLGTVYVVREKRTIAVEQRKIAEAQSAADTAERMRVADNSFNIAQTQDLTVRFRALMDGYEVHIRDLSNDLVASRTENKTLRDEVGRLTLKCRDCSRRTVEGFGA